MFQHHRFFMSSNSAVFSTEKLFIFGSALRRNQCKEEFPFQPKVRTGFSFQAHLAGGPRKPIISGVTWGPYEWVCLRLEPYTYIGRNSTDNWWWGLPCKTIGTSVGWPFWGPQSITPAKYIKTKTPLEWRKVQWFLWMVVSFFLNVLLYLGKISNLTNIFKMGWNHQPVLMDGGFDF